MNNIDIKKVVYKGIRKTITRFRKKPFHYFTEADIHSTLLNDIMTGASDILTFRPSNNNHISVSLVHQEYPTNFRFMKDKLLAGYKLDEIKQTKLDYETKVGKGYGYRGHFDLSVLNNSFVTDMMTKFELHNALKQIINKDNKVAKKRLENSFQEFQKELLYAIEVKLIHPFNARQINMLHEVIKDDNKLRLSHFNSGGFIKPINLVFCSTPAKVSRGRITPVVELIKQYVVDGYVEDRQNIQFNHPEEILTIFIESYIGDKLTKKTQKPLVSKNPPAWAEPLISGYTQTI